MSEDAGIEPRTVATSALAVTRLYPILTHLHLILNSATYHPQNSTTSRPHSPTSHPQLGFLSSSKLDYISSSLSYISSSLGYISSSTRRHLILNSDLILKTCYISSSLGYITVLFPTWYDKNVVPDRQVGLHPRSMPVQDLLNLNLKREQPEIFNMAARVVSCYKSCEVYFFKVWRSSGG